MKKDKILDTKSTAEGLAQLVEDLGYRDDRFKQLLFQNGAAASSLIDFFDDNPGAVEAVLEWVGDNYGDESDEGEDDLEIGDDDEEGYRREEPEKF